MAKASTKKAQKGGAKKGAAAAKTPKKGGSTKKSAASESKVDAKLPVVRIASPKDFERLMNDVLVYAKRASTESGHAGQMVGEYVRKKFIHRGAFAMMKRLVKIGKDDPGALWIFLQHFDSYRKFAALDEIAERQGQLLDADAGEEAEDGDEAGEGETEVETFEQPGTPEGEEDLRPPHLQQSSAEHELANREAEGSA